MSSPSQDIDKYEFLRQQEAKDPRVSRIYPFQHINPIPIIYSFQFDLVSIKILEGEVEGRWWGPRDRQPILCLHGWLDNCGAFDTLIPLLPKEHSYLALDLPGHGRSYKRPIGLGYTTLDIMVFIERIRRHFNWEKVCLMGHSYSSFASFYYAAINPEKVHLLIGLDNLEPYNYNTVTHLRKSMAIYLRVIDDNEKTLHDEPPSYTYEELLEKIVIGSTNSVPRSLAHLLILRNVLPSKKHPGKYFFSFDQTWKALSRDPRHEEDSKIMARQIKCPVLYLLGDDSYIRDRNINNTLKIVEYWETQNQNLRVQFVPGNHHFLMTHPKQAADFIGPFLSKVSTACPIRNKL